MIDDREIRMRCIEAAVEARANLHGHKDGVIVAVMEAATTWFNWVNSGPRPAAGAEPTLEKIAESASMLY